MAFIREKLQKQKDEAAKMQAHQALWLFIRQADKDGKTSGEILPPASHTLRQVYDEHKSADGFLYMVYSMENTFGQ